jgi:hypothetical protein
MTGSRELAGSKGADGPSPQLARISAWRRRFVEQAGRYGRSRSRGFTKRVALLVVGAVGLVLLERLLREGIAAQSIVSRLLAPGGLANSAHLLAAVGYFVLRLLVAGCLPGLVLARGVSLLLRRRDAGEIARRELDGVPREPQ